MNEQKVIFVINDYDMEYMLSELIVKLEGRGYEIIRGPRTQEGIKMQYPAEQLNELFGRADVAVFCSRGVCSQAVMEAGKRLRGLVTLTVGIDSIDRPAANKLGLVIGHGAIPNNYYAVSEATVMLALMLLYNPMRSMKAMTGEVKKPGWSKECDFWSRCMFGKTMGIIGLGRIGREVANKLQNWNCRILARDDNVKEAPDHVTLVDKDTLLKESDIVFIHCILTPETVDLINERELSLMKPSAFIINTARGGIINEDALYRALKEKRIAGAALDVFKQEPLSKDSPLWTLDNIIMTPHLISHTVEAHQLYPQIAFDHIEGILRGEVPKYCANPEVIPAWKERVARLDAQSAGAK